MRKLVLMALSCTTGLGLVAIAPAAAFATPNSSVVAVSSTGGATMWSDIYPYLGTVTGQICDTKADGHHAYGETQVSISGGPWQVVKSGSDYGGNGHCTTIDYPVDNFAFDNIRVRTEAWTKEGSQTIGSPEFSATWSGYMAG